MNKNSETLMYNDTENGFIKSDCEDSACIIKGASGSGKTNLLLERYRYMTGSLGVPADSILILLSDRQKLENWRNAADIGFAAGSGSGCFTYTGFIQEELNTYYPLITISDREINRKEIMPLFLGYDASNFLVSKSIQLRREREGAFRGLVSTNENAAAQLLKSLSAAVSNNIPADEAAIRLAEALERKSAVKTGILSEAYSVMKSYRSKCLELGVFDLALSVALYNEYLLCNKFYCNALKKKIRHVLVDDLHSCTPVQIKLLRLLADSCSSYVFTINTGVKPSEYNTHVFNFIKEIENTGCKSIDLQQSYTCSPDIYCFSEMISNSMPYTAEHFFKNGDSFADKEKDAKEQLLPGEIFLEGKTLPAGEAKRRLSGTEFIERHAPTELRSEMLQQLGERICSLVEDEGCSPSDIVILSTHADIVTELVISEILAAKGIYLRNMTRREKFRDSALSRAILCFMQLCHPGCKLYPTRDDLRIMLCKLLKLDNVRSAILAGLITSAVQFPAFPEESDLELAGLLDVDNMERYIYIKSWVEGYIVEKVDKDSMLSAGDFIMKALTEVFLDEYTERDELLKVRKMADAAARYEEAGSRFGRNVIKDFISMSGNLSFMSEDIEAGDMEYDQGGAVILTTPAAFLAEGIRCGVALICSLSSRNWLQGGAGELYNPYVLNECWNREDGYTVGMDRQNQWRQMAQTLGMVFKRCGSKIITFESKLSENGFENDGPLPELLCTILDKSN